MLPVLHGGSDTLAGNFLENITKKFLLLLQPAEGTTETAQKIQNRNKRSIQLLLLTLAYWDDFGISTWEWLVLVFI